MLNTNFDVVVTKNTDTEYQLKVTVGETEITTPNLKNTSVASAEIVNRHLIFTMTDGTTLDLGVVASDVPEYGVCYDTSTKNPTLTRVVQLPGLMPG